MRNLENDRAFDIHRPTSLPGTAIGTVGTTPDENGNVGTGEYSASIRASATHSSAQRQGTGRVLRRSPGPVQTPETRAAFRRLFKSALEAAAKMVDAANTQESMSLTIAADDLDIALSRLWELRDHRDVNWQTILNHAQCMFKQLFAEKRVEQLTAAQCQAIQELVENYLGTSTKTTSDLNEAVRLIEDAGCDPYWAISGDPADEETAVAQE